MPPPEEAHRHQDALLWVKVGVDGYGQEIVSAPIELKVRWEFTRRDILDPDGNRVTVDAMVVTNRVISIGSTMWLGTLEEWQLGSGSGGLDDEVMQVVVYMQSPDVKNRSTRREVGLSKYRDTPPEIE